jgi:hypothetical protein
MFPEVELFNCSASMVLYAISVPDEKTQLTSIEEYLPAGSLPR